MSTVLTPTTSPAPPPDQDPEALIEEARRRARRRRLAYAAALLLALGLAGGLVAAFARSGEHNARPRVPRGFHLVQARGPVAHLRVEQHGTPQIVDVASGAVRRVPLLQDVWWDKKSGLVRVVGTIAGRTQFDSVGTTCLFPGAGSRARLCPAPGVFGLYPPSGASWPLKNGDRVVGRGRVRGREVLWVARFPEQRSALDARTHQLVETVERAHRRTILNTYYTRLPDLPASKVSFVVPDGGAITNTFPPLGSPVEIVHTASLNAVHDDVGATPLWLGPSFRGQRLTAVQSGTTAAQGQKSHRIQPARFVRFVYGDLRLDEFGKERPSWYEQGPAAGKVVLHLLGGAALERGGVLVLARRASGFRPSDAVALSKALRPLGR